MQLRHISPRSSDWMDAMDEEAGGRGWEKLAPEERVKLLRERREEPGLGGERASPIGDKRSASAAEPQGFGLTSPSR
jgi:hypothetical protein